MALNWITTTAVAGAILTSASSIQADETKTNIFELISEMTWHVMTEQKSSKTPDEKNLDAKIQNLEIEDIISVGIPDFSDDSNYVLSDEETAEIHQAIEDIYGERNDDDWISTTPVLPSDENETVRAKTPIEKMRDWLSKLTK